MSKLIAVMRLAAVALGIVAIVATFADTATRATINPFNFFGFFTMQSNIIWLVVIAITGVVVLRGKKQSDLLLLARGCTTAYMILVGVIYNALLAGQEGGVALDWANNVVHIILPVYAVLIRGATDGWVPYPFFNPATGYGNVFIYVIAIAVLTVVTAAIVWALSRLKIVKQESEGAAPRPGSPSSSVPALA